MKKILLILLAFVVSELMFSSSARAQGVYNRAKSMARGVAPSPYPSQPARGNPYQPNPGAVARQPMAPPSGAYAPQAPAQRPVAAPRPSAQTTKELPEDVVRRTVEFQKKRAEDGQPSAQYDLGMRYIKGDGIEKDGELGLKWLQTAAKNGSIQATKKLKEFDDLKKESPLPGTLVRVKKEPPKPAEAQGKDTPASTPSHH